MLQLNRHPIISALTDDWIASGLHEKYLSHPHYSQLLALILTSPPAKLSLYTQTDYKVGTSLSQDKSNQGATGRAFVRDISLTPGGSR